MCLLITIWMSYQIIMPNKTQNLPVASSLCLRRLLPRSFFRIACRSIITALMFILSLGNSTEQATPIPSIKVKHS